MAKVNVNGFAVTPEELERVKNLATSMICSHYDGREIVFKIKKDHVLASVIGDGNWWIDFPYVDDPEKLYLLLTAALEDKR